MPDFSYLKDRMSVDGDDILVRGGTATYFGDSADTQDNGVGAWGWQTRKHPGYLGVALPVRYGKLFTLSPLPRLPQFSPVRVFSPKTGVVQYAHLIDLGPHPDTGRVLDMTIGLVRALGLDPKAGVWDIDYRVIGGAKYLPKGK